MLKSMEKDRKRRFLQLTVFTLVFSVSFIITILFSIKNFWQMKSILGSAMELSRSTRGSRSIFGNALSIAKSSLIEFTRLIIPIKHNGRRGTKHMAVECLSRPRRIVVVHRPSRFRRQRGDWYRRFVRASEGKRE